MVDNGVCFYFGADEGAGDGSGGEDFRSDHQCFYSLGGHGGIVDFDLTEVGAFGVFVQQLVDELKLGVEVVAEGVDDEEDDLVG